MEIEEEKLEKREALYLLGEKENGDLLQFMKNEGFDHVSITVKIGKISILDLKKCHFYKILANLVFVAPTKPDSEDLLFVKYKYGCETTIDENNHLHCRTDIIEKSINYMHPNEYKETSLDIAYPCTIVSNLYFQDETEGITLQESIVNPNIENDDYDINFMVLFTIKKLVNATIKSYDLHNERCQKCCHHDAVHLYECKKEIDVRAKARGSRLEYRLDYFDEEEWMNIISTENSKCKI